MNKTASLTEELIYNEHKPNISVLLETTRSKEIRIVMKQGQVMKEHSAPFPIIIELFEGAINFGIEGKKQVLKKGDLIALDEHIKHDLTAITDCIVRLSLSKHDTVERVNTI